MPHKIVLYNPQAVFYTMPLALLAVGSHLPSDKFDLKIIDGRLESDPLGAVLPELEEALCLGISVLTGAPMRDAIRISRAAKDNFPNIPVIWGGWHTSLFPIKTLEESSVDITVQGQGEETFRELAERLAGNQGLDDLRGIVYRNELTKIQNPPRPLGDMNDFSPHNYGMLRVEKYFNLKGQRQLDYIASTGCYYRCAFCADPFVFNRSWTGLEPIRIGEELEILWKKYKFDDLSFQDETFFTYRKRVVEIAEQFLKRRLQFTWTGTLRADQGERLTDKELALFKKSGLRRVMIGVESGSEAMLNWMDKDITVEQVLISAEKCVRHGIGAIFPFIVGFPNESIDSVQATIEMVKKLRAMNPNFETPIFYYKPYPGSRIAQEVIQNGYQLPQTIEEWADFDYIGSSGPWVDEEKYQWIERFKFYNRFAWGPETWPRRFLQPVARFRCKHDFYRFPIEKALVDRIKPELKLS